MNSTKSKRLVFAGLLILLSTLMAKAQQPTGAIIGTVTDEKGATISGAAVTITDQATGRAINLTANDEGYFIARSLPPGTYSIKVEQKGFGLGVIDDAIIQTGQVLNASITLKVGNITESVQVEGTDTRLQVDTTRQTIDGVITAEQIVQLPLNGRNFLDLAVLQPSVIVRDGGAIDPIKVNAYRTVGINGTSGTGTRVQIDGVDVTDETVGSTTSNISTDAVQGFQLSRAAFDLSTSLTTSGAVNINTRSGSNEFHGSGFYFFRNEKLGARLDFLSNKPPFHRHQQGYRFGGPIMKNKLFFFSNYESTYQADQAIVTSADFPQLNGTVALPLRFRYTTNKIDWTITDRAKLFYSHRYNDDLSTGGRGNAPFQNVNWTNVHVLGADITGARVTHSLRLGYVNYNNRIQSQELEPFTFLRTPQDIRYFLRVGSFALGPNQLAPQQTYQDNYQSKYDGSYTSGNHTLRYGGEVNRIILGGFANFAGSLRVVGLFNNRTRTALPESERTNPLAYPLSNFFMGPNTGFTTAAPAHGLPHGGHFNTRLAWYAGDSWRIRRNFTLNFGTRYEYDTGYFSPKGTPELPILNVYGPEKGKLPKFPKTAFSPQLGFAWDPTGHGKTSVRGGFSLAYEMNILNNSYFDEFQRLPSGIGPEFISYNYIHGPDGRPIDLGGFPEGDYSSLIGKPIRDVIGTIGRIYQAVLTAYSNFTYDPRKGPSVFENSRGEAIGGIFPGDYKLPYAMQFTIGIQRELFPHHVLSADYVRIRGVGLPFLVGDYERRRAANTLDPLAARSTVAGVIDIPVASLTPAAIDAYLAARPNVTIDRFNLATDTVYPGTTRTLLNAGLMTGGFSLYNGLQVRMDGRFSRSQTERVSIGGARLIRDLDYTISYALARAEATSGSVRSEIFNFSINNDNWNSAFGPTGLDRTHILSAGVNMAVLGGFRFNQIWTFRTPTAQSLFAPFLDNFNFPSSLFTTDLNGDGLSSDLLPGTNVGALGRKIKSFKQLNQIIRSFNERFAGQITPAGQALVNKGIFTTEQLVRLGATIKPIPLVPETNPWPFENQFNLDLRITRPIRIKERFEIESSLDVFNVFNHTALGGLSSSLDGTFGSLNYDYVTDPQRRGGIPELNRSIRHRSQSTRLLQLGIRVTF